MINYKQTKQTQKRGIMFKQWFTKKWAEEGGLIRQADVSRLMNITPTRVTQMIKEGKIKGIKEKTTNNKYCSYSEIIKLINNNHTQEK